MIRKRLSLLAIISLISLLLCAATITLWIRSYFGSDYISRNEVISIEPHAITTQIHAITFTRGSIRFSSESQTVYARPNPRTGTTMPFHLGSRPPYWSRGRLGPNHIGWDYFENDNSHWFNHLGFHLIETGHGASFYDTYEHIFAIPAWLPTVLFALAPLIWFRRIIKARRRRRANLCPHCGYDIRATPQRCPECGRVTLANH